MGKEMATRGFVSTIILAVCLILTIVALATPAVTYSTTISGTQYKSEIGLFRTCSKTGGTTTCANTARGSCGKWKDKVRAAQAFYLMSFFVMVAAIVCTVFNMLGLPLIVPSFIPAAVLGVTAFFQLIGWAIGFSLYSEAHCGSGSFDDAGYKVGASAPILFVVWVATIVTIVLNFVLPPAAHDSFDAFRNKVQKL